MREVISIATMFLLLAAAGMKVPAQDAAKTCKTASLAAIFSPC